MPRRKAADDEPQDELPDMPTPEEKAPTWEMGSPAVQRVVQSVIDKHFGEALSGKPVVALMNLAENAATPVKYQGVANWARCLAADVYGGDPAALPFGVLFIHDIAWTRMKATERKGYVYHALKYGTQGKDGVLTVFPEEIEYYGAYSDDLKDLKTVMVEGKLPIPDEEEGGPEE